MNEMEQKILNILNKLKKPLNRNTLAKRVGGYTNNRKEYNSALNGLVKKGMVVENLGRYGIVRRQNIIGAEIVKVMGTFGFAKPDEDGKADIFVPGRFLMGSMPGDKVLLKLSKGSRGELSEGEVYKITEEANSTFVGVISKAENNKYYIIPDQYVQFPMLIKGKIPSSSEVGDKVLARVIARGKRHDDHQVEIIEYFGSSQKASVCAEAILADNNVHRDFPEEVLEQARAISSGAGIHPKELMVRTDLRDWNIFTIDGADTKDIDDAISLTTTKTGWELGVHIADVSYYVTRQSPLDKEAFERGTSVYFANQVVPMLPPELSNGICSLNPDEDRLAFSAIIQIDKKGEIESYDFVKTVIRSRIKGVYSEINQILDNENPPEELTKKYKAQIEVLKEMEKLANILNRNRMNRGAMNLESVESKILIDENGLAVDIIKRETGTSENMIEEFMLVANEAASIMAMAKELPFIYRVHEEPSEDRAEKLFDLLDSLGVSYKRPQKEGSYAAAFCEVLKAVEGTPISGIVNYSMLRTMTKARYSPENLGHFGLALKNYTHFTSPIRRYPDLAIHRILSALLTGMRTENIDKYFRNWVEPCSSHSTAREIAAMNTERDTEDCYKAEYMQQHIGKEFDGVISSTTGFGIFIRLENTVEGMIHTDNFPKGRWNFDNLITFKNEVGGAVLRVGDQIKIKVIKADVASGRIDFAFVEPEKFETK